MIIDPYDESLVSHVKGVCRQSLHELSNLIVRCNTIMGFIRMNLVNSFSKEYPLSIIG